MRTFIAIELSKDWQDLIGKIQHHIKGQSSLRLVKPAQAHLTLKFLGDTDPGQISLIQQSLTTLANSSSSLSLETQTLGAFPSLTRPEIIWLGLKDSPDLMGLAQSLEQPLKLLGFKPESRGFKAHITIGRLKSKAPKELMESLSHIQVPSLIYKVKEILLIQSTLTSQGPIYQTLSRHPLKPL